MSKQCYCPECNRARKETELREIVREMLEALKHCKMILDSTLHEESHRRRDASLKASTVITKAEKGISI